MSKGSRQSLVELESLDEPIEEEEFPLGLGCALELFREKDEVVDILKSLPEVYTDTKAAEILYEKYQKIFDRYQEQPHLLDRHIEELIDLLITQVRNTSPALKHLSLKFLRQIFKVRGPKEVVRRMPHEIADLVPVLIYLENENLEDSNAWESGYVLVMWLSILVINPFHLKLLDGQLPGAELQGDTSIAARLMNVCKKCLILNNNIGLAAPFLVAKFLTRPDMQDLYMDKFITWACDNIQDKAPFGTKVGSFAALSAIFKHAKRQEILPYAGRVLKAVMYSQFEKYDTILRKAGTKLIQRIGMVFLRTKLAPWRYQRGSRSLVKNLQANASVPSTAKPIPDLNGEESENYEELAEYAEAIESIIDKLLEGLRDKDTVVRWSAAKGVGRVTNRLPKDYADEVVESLLGMFSARESNGGWHGACLALAELSRRGLLLPERLPSVIPVVKKALVYDEIRGNFSVGSHVRDAACYVLWAFARAFEPTVVEPYVHEIASSLIVVIVFDREVNCRRAASAAFQENVGRQGNFPRGIDIVTVADYFSIGNRPNAFTSVSLEIGRFEVYTKQMMDHLLQYKVNHFDGSVRELAAEALGKLGQLEPDHALNVALPKLIPTCWDVDTYASNGALYSVGHILAGLKQVGKLTLEQGMLEEIKKIVPNVTEKKFRSGVRGNELIKQALCFFIKSLAAAKIPFHKEEMFLATSYKFLIENIPTTDFKTKGLATDCLRHYFLEYYYQNPAKHSQIPSILEEYSAQLKSSSMVCRQGFANALGKLPHPILQVNFPPVLEALLNCSQIQADTSTWAESRKDALVAITNILDGEAITLEDSENWDKGIPVNILKPERIFKLLLENMEDYTTDKRGDIGSWVRDSAMSCIKILTKGVATAYKDCSDSPECPLNSPVFPKLISLVAKQAVEKIDNIRVRAGKVFSTLLHNDSPELYQFPERSSLLTIFTEDFVKTCNWRATAQMFPKFVELIKFPTYSYPILCGFIISGGSLSDKVMKDANGAVKNYIHASGAIGDQEVIRVGEILLQIFQNNLKVERITLPLLKFTSNLLQSNVLTALMTSSPSFGTNLINLVKSEVVNSSRVEKLVAAVELFCELLQGPPEVVKNSLKRLTIYLCHSFPRVRVHASQKLYESLITYGDDCLTVAVEDMEEIMTLLSETRWDTDVVELRKIRNRLCDLMNVPQPSLLKPGLLSNKPM